MTDWSCDGEVPDLSNVSVKRHDVEHLVPVDIDDSLGKGLRRFLRQIVPDAARDDPVRISAREFPGIGTGVRVWCPIGIAFQRNRGHGDVRTLRRAAVPARHIAARLQPVRAASDNYGSRC